MTYEAAGVGELLVAVFRPARGKPKGSNAPDCRHDICGCGVMTMCCFECPLVRCIEDWPKRERLAVKIQCLRDQGWDDDDIRYLLNIEGNGYHGWPRLAVGERGADQ